MKQITQYNGFGSTPLNHQTIVYFWNILETFTQEQLASYLRYVWGRSRLSHSFGDTHKLNFIAKKAIIPEAHTCFFELDLGEYECEDALKKKLLYGLENCHIIMETSGSLNFGADFAI